MKYRLIQATAIEITEMRDGDFRKHGLTPEWAETFIIENGRVYRRIPRG